MAHRISQPWRVAGATGLLALVLLGAWVLRSPFVGLADNGDWGRYSCPVGLSGDARFDDLPSTLVERQCPAYDYRSTFVPFLAVAKAVETPLFGSIHLRHLAAFWALVAAAGWAWFGFELTRSTGRAGRSCAIAATLVVVSSDVAFSAYFGSLYGEAMIIGLLPALAAALLRCCRAERMTPRLVVGSGLLLVAITAAKPSMAFTAPLFLGVVAMARRRALTPRDLRLPVLAVSALALFSLVGIADPNFGEWNTYNLAFTVVAPESGRPHAALVDMGLSDRDAQRLDHLVGVQFGPSVTDEWDGPGLAAFRSQGRVGVYRSLAIRPRVWWRMIDRSTTTLDDLHLPYLSNHVRDAGSRPGVLLADRPHPANLVLGPLSKLGALLPVLWLAVLARSGRRTWRVVTASEGPSADRPGERTLAALVLFGVTMAATQTLVALGDGYYELAKHLVVAGYGTALVASGLVVAAVWDGVARVGARRSVHAAPTAPSAIEDASEASLVLS